MVSEKGEPLMRSMLRLLGPKGLRMTIEERSLKVTANVSEDGRLIHCNHVAAGFEARVATCGS